MDGLGETCKLCLKYIQGDTVAVREEDLLTKLEFLQMKLVSDFCSQFERTDTTINIF